MSLSITKIPLLPVITVKKNDGTFFTFNHFTDNRQFNLIKMEVVPPYLGTAGSFTITLHDPSASMLTNIRRGNEVTIWIGKTDATKIKVMLGVITSTKVETFNRNYAQVTLSGIDWGSYILASRIINYSWRQLLLPDGSTDPTDTSTNIRQIVLDILTKAACYPTQDPIGSTDGTLSQGMIVTSANITAGADVQLPALSAGFEIVEDKLKQLDGLAINAVHWVDADKTFYMARPSATDSGILLVDDNTDATALAWLPQTKVGLISGLKSSTLEKTIDEYKRRIYGIGAGIDTLESSQTTVTNTDDLSNYKGMRIWNATATPPQSIVNVHISLLGLYLSKSGTPATDPPPTDPIVQLVEDVGGVPKGNVVKSVRIDRTNLQSTTAKVHYCDFNGESLNTSKVYWIVMPPCANVRWHRQATGAGSIHMHAFSTNNIAWTPVAPLTGSSYGYAYEYWYTRDLATQQEDGITTLSNAIFPEDVTRQPDIKSNALMIKYLNSIRETTMKEKWVYKCTVYSPDVLLLNGQKVRIKVTRSPIATFDYADWVVSGIEYVFDSDPDSQTGTFYFALTSVRNDVP